MTREDNAMPTRSGPGPRRAPAQAATSLSGMIVGSLISSHGLGSWLTGLAALTLVLGHDLLARHDRRVGRPPAT
jgi:hypothetical protein